MELHFLLLICALLLDPASSDADSKVNSSTGSDLHLNFSTASNGTDHLKQINGGLPLLSNSGQKNKGDKAGEVKKEVVENGIDKGILSGRESGGNEDKTGPKGKLRANDGREGKVGGDKKDKLEAKQVPEGDVISSSRGSRKEGSGTEECDSSSKCTDKENKLVACLRVPGNDSPDLSLLIQNKGKGPLDVTISAPKFVWLEKTNVQLKEKENKKVKVSARSVGTNNLIVLKAGAGQCSLDFRDLIAHYSEESDPKSLYMNFLTRIPTTAFLVFGTLIIVASALTCISIQRKHSHSNSKYEKLVPEMQISSGEKLAEKASDNEDWDNSWGDNWDDEEAPKTPSMPVTPSLSSKGLASRRLIKEGWKD